MSSIRSNVHEHLRWALTKAGADLVQVSTNYTRGGTDLYVRVGNDQFHTVIYEDTLQDVYQKTVERIKELRAINNVKQRLQG